MRHFLGPSLLAAACAIGCSSNTATEADYDDVAQALSAVIVTDNGGGDLGSMHDSITIATGTPDLSFSLDASGAFSGNHLGLDYHYKVACADAAGGSMNKCDNTSDAAKVGVQWSGDLALPHLTAAVDRKGEWSLSGLQGTTTTFAGSGDFTLDLELQSIFRDASRSYHLAYAADYEAVKFDRTASRLSGGKVSYVIDAERMASGPRRESDAKFHIDGVLTFAADGSATLTLDDSYDYRIDTASGLVIKQ